jgi:hypothetical protein
LSYDLKFDKTKAKTIKIFIDVVENLSLFSWTI